MKTGKEFGIFRQQEAKEKCCKHISSSNCFIDENSRYDIQLDRFQKSVHNGALLEGFIDEKKMHFFALLFGASIVGSNPSLFTNP